MTNPYAANYQGRLALNQSVGIQPNYGGNVLGASTSGGSYSGGGSSGAPQPSSGTPSGPSPDDLLNQAYEGYFRSLDDQMAGLDPQRAAQEGIVTNQYNQSVSDLGAQKTQGMADLGTQRRKTEERTGKSLKDLSDNLRNMFMTGQVYLGARGAGDSSAANQYSYALTQLGSKGRGDILSQQSSIMNDIGDRESRLNNIYTQEKSRLDTEKNNQVLSIAQWFAEAQNQIRNLKGQALLQKGQELLNIGLGRLQMVQQESANRRAALEQWAINTATNINQLKTNMQAVGGFQAPGINTPSIAGTPSWNTASTQGFYPGQNAKADEWWR
jgi:hypothetical protein